MIFIVKNCKDIFDAFDTHEELSKASTKEPEMIAKSWVPKQSRMKFMISAEIENKN